MRSTRTTPVATRPRKFASQARARATVDALIEATSRILASDGQARASTNHIADAAGVSIGSLYQYYPCKEALFAAVIDRHYRNLVLRFRVALAELAVAAGVQSLSRLVEVASEAQRAHPAQHRLPPGNDDAMTACWCEIHALLRDFLVEMTMTGVVDETVRHVLESLTREMEMKIEGRKLAASR